MLIKFLFKLHYYVFMLHSNCSIAFFAPPHTHPVIMSPRKHGDHCPFISPPFLNLLLFSASSSPFFLRLFRSCLFSTLKLSECPEFSWLTPPVCLRVFVYARVCVRVGSSAWHGETNWFVFSPLPHAQRGLQGDCRDDPVSDIHASAGFPHSLYTFRLLLVCPELLCSVYVY